MTASRRTMTGPALWGLLLILGACDARTPAPVADIAADRAAIRQVLDEIAAAFSDEDYDRMFALYRDDVVVSPPGAPDVIGKDAWRAGLAATIPPNLDLTLRFDTEELEIDGDLAYERGTYHVENIDKATGATLPPINGRHIHIFKREVDGSWKGWRLMENSAEPPAPPP